MRMKQAVFVKLLAQSAQAKGSAPHPSNHTNTSL